MGAALLGLLLLGGCAGPKTPGPTAVNDIFGRPYQGFRSSEPDLLDGDKRLDMFLGVPHPPPEDPDDVPLADPEEWADVIYCIAFNEEKEPLREAERLLKLSPQDKAFYIWGSPIREKSTLWWDGVRCRAHAVQVWHVKAHGYVILDLDYTLPWHKRYEIRQLLRKALAEGKDLAPL